MVCGLHIFQRFIWKPIQYQLHIIVKREARLDQIYKTDLNELFSYQRKGEKLEEKEKVIEIEIERLRDFKEHASKKDIMDGIVKKYRLDLLAPPEPADEGNASGGQDQAKDESSQPQTKKQQTRDKKKTGGSNLQTSPRARRTPPQEPKPEVSANGQT